MTAAQAAAIPSLRQQVALDCRTSDASVRAVLGGYPLRPGLATAIAAALDREGVDLATIPTRTPEEVSAWRVRRGQPKGGNEHARIARLMESVQAERAKVAALEQTIADLRAELAEKTPPAPKVQEPLAQPASEVHLAASPDLPPEAATALLTVVRSAYHRDAKPPKPALRRVRVELDGADITPEREAG